MREVHRLAAGAAGSTSEVLTVFAHSRCPVRIGIAGGGTDLPAWLATGREGRCLSLAIATYTHAVAITRPDRQVVASYRQRDVASCATEIANGLIRESALMHGWEDGFEVHTLSEVASHGSGLGVSSSIAVALAEVFAHLRRLEQGKFAEPRWRDGGEAVQRLAAARDAWAVEIDRLKRPIGRQDHMAAAYGGLRLYAFENVRRLVPLGATCNECGHHGDNPHGVHCSEYVREAHARVERTYSEDDARWVAHHLLLIRLPDDHDARAILSGAKDVAALEPALEAVAVAEKAIKERSPALLGRALFLGQASKRAIPGASPKALTDLVERIERTTGVHGCKVAGAGGGGHLVVACEPSARGEIERVAELPGMLVTPDFGGVRSEGWT